jgi:type IV secretory pathway TrbD component
LPARPSSEAAEAGGPERTPIHEALVRRPLYFGVPKDYLVMEASLLVLLVVVFWPSFDPGHPPSLGAFGPVLVVAALFLLVIHPVLARASKKDPKWLDILVRARRIPEVLLRTPLLASRRVQHWTSLPR